MRAGLAVIARERADEGKAAGDLPCAPSDLIQRLNAVCVHPLADLVRDAGAGLRVQEVRGADLYRRCTGHDELQGVLTGQNEQGLV